LFVCFTVLHVLKNKIN